MAIYDDNLKGKRMWGSGVGDRKGRRQLGIAEQHPIGRYHYRSGAILWTNNNWRSYEAVHFSLVRLWRECSGSELLGFRNMR